jgi:hypothetical protein
MEVTDAETAAGSTKFTTVVWMHPRPSVTNTEYTPEASPNIVEVVDPSDHKYE